MLITRGSPSHLCFLYIHRNDIKGNLKDCTSHPFQFPADTPMFQGSIDPSEFIFSFFPAYGAPDQASDPSCHFNLQGSSWEHRILNPLCLAECWICVLVLLRHLPSLWATAETPEFIFKLTGCRKVFKLLLIPHFSTDWKWYKIILGE